MDNKLKNIPNCQFNYRDVNEVTYNEYGLLENDFGAKAPGEKRILTLGGQLISGEMVSSENRLPFILNKKLNELTGKSYVVLNGGVYGAGLGYFEEHLSDYIKLYNPDVILLFVEPKVISSDYLKDLAFFDVCPYKMVFDFNSAKAAEKLSANTIMAAERIKVRASQLKIPVHQIWVAGMVKVSDFLVNIKGCNFLNAFISQPSVDAADFETVMHIKNIPVIQSQKFRDAFHQANAQKGNGKERTVIYNEIMAKHIAEEIKTLIN